MNPIIKLEKSEIVNALPLFGDIPLGWDVMLAAAREFGFFLADDRVKPNVALAFIGGCILYAGDSNHEAARSLVQAMKVQPLILPHPKQWATLIKDVWLDRVKLEERFFLPFSSLNRKTLAQIELGTSPGFALKRIDAEIACRLEAEMDEVAQLHHYFSLEDFVTRGGGFCIVKGEEICSMAIAFLEGNKAIQIQIATKDQFRRRGLATIAGAALLNHCLDNGIRADWDASTISSRALAYKLGYTQCIPYEGLAVFP